MKTTPYSLAWGADVYAKVVAINKYGMSAESAVGNGAKIITNPDAPTLFVENYALRTATSLSFTWVEGAANGGSLVLDYQVSYKLASDTNYSLLASGILSTSYTAVSLMSGLAYNFRVRARNAFGLSVDSVTLSLNAGFKPA